MYYWVYDQPIRVHSLVTPVTPVLPIVSSGVIRSNSSDVIDR